MTCPACLASAPDTARFCPECGTPFANPSEATTVVTPRPDSERKSSDPGLTRPATPVSPDAPTILPPTPSPGWRSPTGAGRTTGPASPSGSGTPKVAATPPPGSDPRLGGRFPPGTLLGGRYRIVGLLGKGGMGEVYRADDLVLGQPVALKFLPESLVGDAEWLARFRGEVRVARQVSHPNVCRVYDIAEADGFTFVSMEFVHGEDLSSLLRRIGRLAPDKASEMARGLCAGLAAAHDKHLVHRDLKPGNVLIDEHGRVRLADFGLAGGAGVADEALVGTPAYMAPELFERQPATVASDIYALGLVLYEMFAGKPAFSGATIGELARQHRETAPTRLTQIVAEIDPVADRIIQRCLAKNPADRPASALQVAAALPGGDPLAAALAAGETPSPEMVADSGGIGALQPRVALGILAAALAGLAVVAALSRVTQALQYIPYKKPPAVLIDAAHTIVQHLGFRDPIRDQAWGFTTTDYLTYIEANDPSPTRYENLRPGQPPGVTFWYRQSPVPLVSDSLLLSGRVVLNVPPPTVPGMVGLMLDLKGRLQFLTAVLPRVRDKEEPGVKFEWDVLLRDAGFDPAKLTPVEPSWIPPDYADQRAAWNGVYPDRPDIQVHLEAASAHGHPVYFQIFEPWSPQTLAPPTAPTGVSIRAVLSIIGVGLLIAGANILARRNLRLGRGNREGAGRVAGALGILTVIMGLLMAHQTFEVGSTLQNLLVLAARGALVGLVAYTVYMALEPDVRRRSPETLIAWSRALDGRLSDPLVGRDVLLGVALGALLQLLAQAGHIAPTWFGAAPTLSTPLAGFDGTLAAGLATVLRQVVVSVLAASTLLLMYLMLYALIRRRVVTMVVFVLLLFGIAEAVQGVSVSLVFAALGVAVIVITLARAGLLALVAALTVNGVLEQIPLTFDPSSLLAPTSYTVLVLMAVAAAYGFRASLGGRAIVGRGMLD